MPWTVENFKPFEKNTLRGFFSLNVSGMVIDGFTYHQKGGKRWVGFPAKSYIDDNGDTQWQAFIRIKDKSRYEKFQKWARDEVAKLATQAPAHSEPEEKDSLPF